jgi:hypothetical protein
MSIEDADQVKHKYQYEDYKETLKALTKEVSDSDSDDEDEAEDCCNRRKPFRKLNSFHFRVCDAFDEECRRQHQASEFKQHLAEFDDDAVV